MTRGDMVLVGATVIAAVLGTQLVLSGYAGILLDRPVTVTAGDIAAMLITAAFAMGILPAIARLRELRRWACVATCAATASASAALWAHGNLLDTVLRLPAGPLLATGALLVSGALAAYYVLAVLPTRRRPCGRGAGHSRGFGPGLRR